MTPNKTETSARKLLAIDEIKERRENERSSFSRAYRDLVCPHCDQWIGDPTNSDISSISISHDLDSCEGHCKELIGICHDIYDAIATDSFGINGATSKSDYVSVIAEHLSWSEDGLMSHEARSLYTALTSTARDELVGRAYLAMNGGER